MHILLDTHTFLWWLDGDRKLTKKAKNLIQAETNSIYISAASAWEIAIKVKIGKLPYAVEVAMNFKDILISQDFKSLPISISHAQKAGLLGGKHRDPFDRMLIAQSLEDNLFVLTDEVIFDEYGVQRLWDD